LGQQLRDCPARVVHGLAHLDRLSAVRGRIEQPGAPAGVDLDLQRHAALPAIPATGLVVAGEASRTRIPIESRFEVAELARPVGKLDACAYMNRPIACTEALARPP